MLIYKRTIYGKLLSLRILLFISGTVCFLAFKYQYDNLGYFIAVALVLLSIIVVKNFIVFQDSFQVSKYYFFGLIRLRWKFNPNNHFRVTSLGSDFGGEADMPSPSDELGCLLSILSIFLPPKPRIMKKEFRIERQDEVSGPFNRVHIFLDSAEFNYLKSFYIDPKPKATNDF